jgi:hypothetical protein
MTQGGREYASLPPVLVNCPGSDPLGERQDQKHQ